MSYSPAWTDVLVLSCHHWSEHGAAMQGTWCSFLDRQANIFIGFTWHVQMRKNFTHFTVKCHNILYIQWLMHIYRTNSLHVGLAGSIMLRCSTVFACDKSSTEGKWDYNANQSLWACYTNFDKPDTDPMRRFLQLWGLQLPCFQFKVRSLIQFMLLLAQTYSTVRQS